MAKFGTNGATASVDIHSFVIRIWLDEVDPKTRLRAWHGQITYALNGERRYFKNLSEITAFINSHLPIDREM